jgi:predicted transcriptional regulator
MAERRDRRPSLPSGTLLRVTLEMLWNHGRSSIRDVVERMENKLGSGVPYSTVASVLNKLCEAGFATRSQIQGAREYLYSALVSREQVEKAATMEAVQTVFERSRNQRLALSYLVEVVSQSDRRHLVELKKLVERRRREMKAKSDGIPP